ncbi:MAG: hypothetical protein GY702_10370, partial [Desulfobulbaceae bacterium]|nr:hypothetical protein [Desulfobulbaceae bacterium]
EVCDWRDRDATFARLRADVHQRLATGKPSPIAASATCSFPFTLEEHLAVARSSARQFEEQAARSGGRLPPTKQSFVAKRIRLGYLSSDFRDHPVGQLMGSVFQHHDRARFSVCAYSYGQDDKTPYRQLIRSCVERFVDVRKTTDFEIAKRIQADGIDILIDLNGYTVGGRSAVLAHRPAPVQISYLGFPGTMGAQFVDYVIADSTAVPPAEAKFYDEHLIYVPPSYLVASDHAISTTRPTRSAQGLPESGAIFCGFNNSVKIEPEVFDAWMQILRRVPHSVLWLRTNWRSGVANLRREARSRGVDPDRLVFAYKEPYKADHLARQRLADVFLDTPLYNAHTTALDALMAGVPVITCRGRTFAGRGAASLLTGLDMPELIADDLEAYKELAVCLANDPSELSKINKKLALQSAKSDVFSPAGFVNKLERAYEAVRHRYLAGEPAGPISTDDDTPAASVATDQEPIRR